MCIVDFPALEEPPNVLSCVQLISQLWRRHSMCYNVYSQFPSSGRELRCVIMHTVDFPALEEMHSVIMCTVDFPYLEETHNVIMCTVGFPALEETHVLSCVHSISQLRQRRTMCYYVYSQFPSSGRDVLCVQFISQIWERRTMCYHVPVDFPAMEETHNV